MEKHHGEFVCLFVCLLVVLFVFRVFLISSIPCIQMHNVCFFRRICET